MDPMNMNSVSGLGGRDVSPGVGVNPKKAINEPPATGPPVEDAAELSPEGLALSQADDQSASQADDQSATRFTRMCEIRDALAERSFETFERMDGTAKKLIEVLGWKEQPRPTRRNPNDGDHSSTS
jgi:hypothetical protein